jgi:hypothetical protein
MLRIILLLALSVAVSSAQEANPSGAKLPEEPARIKRTYEQEKQRVLQPLLERYVADMKRCLDDATRAGKLADALAIKAEIDATSAETLETIAAFNRKIIGIVWKWNGLRDFNFKPDGTADRGTGMTWKSVAPYLIQYRETNGYHGTINFEHDLSRATINEIMPDGKLKTLKLEPANN